MRYEITGVAPRASPETTEAELVALALDGDQQAFTDIMSRCNQRLYRIARAVVRDDDEAEDVLQEAYLRAFTGLSRFRGESSLTTWLTQITLNEARGRLRKRRAQSELREAKASQLAAESLCHEAGPAGPEAAAARSQTRRLIEAAIDDLPGPFRAVFVLRAVEQLTVQETADRLQLPEETVRTRHFRAKRRLQERLREPLHASVTEAFPFLGQRCAAVTRRVLSRLTGQ